MMTTALIILLFYNIDDKGRAASTLARTEGSTDHSITVITMLCNQLTQVSNDSHNFINVENTRIK